VRSGQEVESIVRRTLAGLESEWTDTLVLQVQWRQPSLGHLQTHHSQYRVVPIFGLPMQARRGQGRRPLQDVPRTQTRQLKENRFLAFELIVHGELTCICHINFFYISRGVFLLVKDVNFVRSIPKYIDYGPWIITSRFDDVDAFLDNDLCICNIIWRGYSWE
jgi:hypothetical protein